MSRPVPPWWLTSALFAWLVCFGWFAWVLVCLRFWAWSLGQISCQRTVAATSIDHAHPRPVAVGCVVLPSHPPLLFCVARPFVAFACFGSAFSGFVVFSPRLPPSSCLPLGLFVLCLPFHTFIGRFLGQWPLEVPYCLTSLRPYAVFRRAILI